MWWRAFRRWPWWAQALVWGAACPVPLVLLALADPGRRRLWAGAAAATSLVWLALVVETATQPERVEAVADEATPTTEPTATTRERIGSTTTAPASPLPGPAAGVTADPTTTGGLSASGAGPFAVADLLDRLTVAPAASGAAYDRGLFEHWTDDDGDGCDTRAEVLQAESATPVVEGAGCTVVTGAWLSIYDGYSTPNADELEVDHLVALHEAWRSGASTWAPDRRRAFANDLGHPGALVAVTAAMNRSKGDRDPASWQPPNRAAWCLYATDWIAVKARWDLTVDDAEATALRNMLAGCGAAPTTTTAPPPPPPPPVVAPVPLVPTPAPSGDCHPSYPGVCIPPAPPDLDCGDIPHRRFTVLPPDPHGFDGNDNDGLGCESG